MEYFSLLHVPGQTMPTTSVSGSMLPLWFIQGTTTSLRLDDLVLSSYGQLSHRIVYHLILLRDYIHVHTYTPAYTHMVSMEGNSVAYSSGDRSLKSGCWQSPLPPEVLGENSFLLFLVLMTIGIPWCPRMAAVSPSIFISIHTQASIFLTVTILL